MEFEFGSTQPEARAEYRPTAAGPMRILLLGDFSGRGNRGLLEPGDGLASRPISAVDVDNFDEILFRYAPRLNLPLGDPSEPAMTVEFKQLDDFIPDELYRRLELFQGLRETRQRLLDPETFPQAAAELKRAAGRPAAPTTDAGSAVPGEPIEEDDASTLSRLLGKKPVETPQVRAVAARPVDLSVLIRGLVGPYVVPGTDPQRDQLVSSVDIATSDRMRALLRHPAFQALEASWRSAHWLVSGLETGEDLRICLLDVTKEELAADLRAAAADPSLSGLYRLLVETGPQTPGGQPWSVLVGNYRFGTAPEDLSLLAALGSVGWRAGGPFLSAADPVLLGCADLEASPEPERWSALDTETERRWQALRRSSVASWLGLTLPRFLLRLPYGARSDEIDSFDFEELPPSDVHEGYLWGNAAFVCAMLLGSSFLENGWSMEPGDQLEIDDLPAHTFDDGGEPRMKPCAEVCLSQRTAERILAHGLMPLLSYRDRNAARLMRFQSLNAPPTGLSGPWA